MELSIFNPTCEMKSDVPVNLSRRFNLNDGLFDALKEEVNNYILTPVSKLPAFNEGDAVHTYWLSVIKIKTGNRKLQFCVLGR